jgi:tRNA (guanine-N7-)-methyltransferase
MSPKQSHSKLPVHDAGYRYPPSHNPYWTKIKDFAQLVYSDNDTEAHPGKWREQFPDHKPARGRELHVEIGCNAGHVVVEWAQRNPQAAYMGLDWKFKAIHKGAEKVVKRGIKNLVFLRGYAERTNFMFAPGEVDFLYLFFPDPWPKKAQRKNRFVTPEKLRRLAPIVKPGGVFHIKTDHAGYFEWMEAAIAEVGDLWEVMERTNDLHAGHPDPTQLQIPEVTLFERIFVKEGIRINSIKLRRRA